MLSDRTLCISNSAPPDGAGGADAGGGGGVGSICLNVVPAFFSNQDICHQLSARVKRFFYLSFFPVSLALSAAAAAASRRGARRPIVSAVTLKHLKRTRRQPDSGAGLSESL